MSDTIDALQRKIKKLERDLVLQKVGDDPRKLALLAAGVPADRLSDASKVFRPSGTATGMMTLDDVTGDINSLARTWLETRPWFGTPEPEAAPEPGDQLPRIENGRAYFSDGSSLPIDLVGSDDLFAMAGPAPKPVKPEPAPDTAYAKSATSDDDHLSSLDKDFRDAGPFPGKRA
jgi:hypothetical protein